MKRTRLEKLDDPMFRPLTPEECRMTMGGISKKVTGKITFQQAAALAEEPDAGGGVDGEADVEFDF